MELRINRVRINRARPVAGVFVFLHPIPFLISNWCAESQSPLQSLAHLYLVLVAPNWTKIYASIHTLLLSVSVSKMYDW